MKICFVCSEYPPGPHGGIGTMTRVLGRALAQAGHEVRSIGVYPKAYPAPDYEEDQGVRIWRLREPERKFGWAALRARLYWEVAAWASRGEVDIVEVPDYQGPAAGWPGLPVPVVARLHGSETYFAGELGESVGRIPFLIERTSLRRVDFWSSVCRYTAEKTRDLFRLKSGPHAILYNPVELPELPQERSRDRHRIVFSGTLARKKGIVQLIEAWPRVLAQCPTAVLDIFGKDGRTAEGGSMREFLEQRLAPAARASVRFHGHVTRETLFHSFFSARAAVFPSYAEAFAVAPLECMACECPTIYSRRGSGPELLADGREGLLVDPDKPEEIAASMIRVLQDDALASALGRAGRERVERQFSLGGLVPENLAFYASCIQWFGRSASHRAAAGVML